MIEDEFDVALHETLTLGIVELIDGLGYRFTNPLGMQVASVVMALVQQIVPPETLREWLSSDELARRLGI